MPFESQEYENRKNESLWNSLPDINLNDARGRDNFLQILNDLPIDQLYSGSLDINSWFIHCINKIDATFAITGFSEEAVQDWNQRCRDILANKLKIRIQSESEEEEAIRILNSFSQLHKTVLKKEQIAYWVSWIVICMHEKWSFFSQDSQSFNTVLNWPMAQLISLYSSVASKQLFVDSLCVYNNSFTGTTRFEALFLPKMLSYVDNNDVSSPDGDVLVKFLSLLDDEVLKNIALGKTNTLTAILNKIFAPGTDRKLNLLGSCYFQMMEQHFDCFWMIYQVLEKDEKKKFYDFFVDRKAYNILPSLALLEKCLSYCSNKNDFDYLQFWAIKTMIERGFVETMRERSFNIQEFKNNFLRKIYPYIHDNQMCIMTMLKTISECWKNLSEREQSMMLQEMANDVNLRYFFEHCFAALPETRAFNRSTAAKEFALFAALRSVSVDFRNEIEVLSAHKFQFPNENTTGMSVTDESGVTILNAIPVTIYGNFKKMVGSDKMGFSLTEADARVRNKQNAQIYQRPGVNELIGQFVVAPSAPPEALMFEGKNEQQDSKKQTPSNINSVSATPTAPVWLQDEIPIAVVQVLESHVTRIPENQIISGQGGGKMTPEEKENEERKEEKGSFMHNGQLNSQAFLYMPSAPTHQPVILPDVPTSNVSLHSTSFSPVRNGY